MKTHLPHYTEKTWLIIVWLSLILGLIVFAHVCCNNQPAPIVEKKTTDTTKMEAISQSKK